MSYLNDAVSTLGAFGPPEEQARGDEEARVTKGLALSAPV